MSLRSVFRLVLVPGLCLAADTKRDVNAEAGRTTCMLTSDTHTAEGVQLLELGRVAEARDAFERALNASSGGARRERSERACLLNMIGYAALQQLRPDQAISWFEEALQCETTGVLKAIILSNLASAWLHLHRIDRAEEVARAALRVAEAAVGPDTPDTLAPQAIVADIHFQRGELAEAEPIYRRLLFQAEKFWGPDAYETGLFSGSLGMTYLYQRRFGQARPLLERSVALAGQRPGDAANYDALLANIMIGLTYAGEGRARQANEVLERALARAEAELGSGTVDMARLLLRAGLAKLVLRDRDQGKLWCERAIAIFEAQDGGARSGEAIESLRAYLAALRNAGDSRGAQRIEAKLKSLRG